MRKDNICNLYTVITLKYEKQDYPIRFNFEQYRYKELEAHTVDNCNGPTVHIVN